MSDVSCPRCKLELFPNYDYPDSGVPNEVPASRPFACPRCRAVIVHRDPAEWWSLGATGALCLAAVVAFCVGAGWIGLLIAIPLVVLWFFATVFVAALLRIVVPDRLEMYSLETSVPSASPETRVEDFHGRLAKIADLLDELARAGTIPKQRMQQFKELTAKTPGREILESGVLVSMRLAAELARKNPYEHEVEMLRRELQEVAAVLRLLAPSPNTSKPTQT